MTVCAWCYCRCDLFQQGYGKLWHLAFINEIYYNKMWVKMWVCAFVRVCTSVHVREYVSMSVCMCVHVCAWVCVYASVCVCVCVWASSIKRNCRYTTWPNICWTTGPDVTTYHSWHVTCQALKAPFLRRALAFQEIATTERYVSQKDVLKNNHNITSTSSPVNTMQ